MAGDKILVFGATGPAGICLLRELVHRNIPAIAYCRNPAKLPEDIVSQALIEVAQGNLAQRELMSAAVAKSRIVVSLLGPSSMRQPKNTEFADYYKIIVSLMKEHGVRRILALGTTAMYRPEDQSSVSRAVMSTLIRVLASGAHHNVLAIQDYFEHLDEPQIEWVVYRIGNLSGSSDAESWLADRSKGKVTDGAVGESGFTSGINRSLLARWLVDVATSDPFKWAQQMPAPSQS